MRVLVAGSTGAIGRPLIKQLVESGHEVVGMARNDRAAKWLRDQGAKAEIADARDRDAMYAAVTRSAPEVVINQLTALPKQYSFETMKAAAPVDQQLRREGGANLQAAAKAGGARRYILQSSAFWYEPGEGLADEGSGFAINATPYIAAGSRFYSDLEKAAFAMAPPELVVLRYGFLYGPGTWFATEGSVAEQVRNQQFPIVGDGNGVWSWIHVEDAAHAAVLSLDHGSSGPYNIVDDDPSEVRTWLPAYARWLKAPIPPAVSAERAGVEDLIYNATRLRGASNVKARRELHFQPRRLEWLANGAQLERRRGAA